jgi:hypothetical protein
MEGHPVLHSAAMYTYSDQSIQEPNMTQILPLIAQTTLNSDALSLPSFIAGIVLGVILTLLGRRLYSKM